MTKFWEEGVWGVVCDRDTLGAFHLVYNTRAFRSRQPLLKQLRSTFVLIGTCLRTTNYHTGTHERRRTDEAVTGRKEPQKDTVAC
jgi:hypothetical protein